MKNYSLSSCEDLIDRYINQYGGCILQIEEGCLGLGKILLHSAPKVQYMLGSQYTTHQVYIHYKDIY